MKPALLVLAAGLGTRYGGLKQIDPVGPHGQTLIDYSIYGAIRAGFGKVVFVIRHYFEDAFKEIVSSKFDRFVETDYVYQELDACLGDFPLPADRERPWGTGHAILASRDAFDEPFAVVNADDYYGVDSLKAVASFLTSDVAPDRYAMIGYILRNTMSEYGSVARGITECDEGMFLKRIVERKRIEKANGGIRYLDADGMAHPLTGDEIVSTNLWGFHPSIFAHLAAQFRQFLQQRGHEKDSELYIPSVVDAVVAGGQAGVEVRKTRDEWFGVTYRADAPAARRCIQRLTAEGAYPERLWE
jgi:NDP-sugar pyrophosphorylase family protein